MQNIIDELITRYPRLERCKSDIRDAVFMIDGCYRRGGKMLVAGNGGSAADSEHIVGELMKSFKIKRKVDEDFRRRYVAKHGEDAPGYLEGALPTVSLVSQSAFMTAFSNDRTAVGAFAQQVYGYADSNDALMLISTSGESGNLIEAAKVAQAKELAVIALTGQGESELSRRASIAIKVPEHETLRVQELHLPVYHAICAALESLRFSSESAF